MIDKNNKLEFPEKTYKITDEYGNVKYIKDKKLEFPEKKHKITDEYGNVKYIKSRKTNIGKHIWTDADIKYYDELTKLFNKAIILNAKINKAKNK
jgi:hypothetical protein